MGFRPLLGVPISQLKVDGLYINKKGKFPSPPRGEDGNESRVAVGSSERTVRHSNPEKGKKLRLSQLCNLCHSKLKKTSPERGQIQSYWKEAVKDELFICM